MWGSSSNKWDKVFLKFVLPKLEELFYFFKKKDVRF
jgi:hypothetical protein